MDIWAIERTIKYLHFACRTFLKNVKNISKINLMFQKPKNQNISRPKASVDQKPSFFLKPKRRVSIWTLFWRAEQPPISHMDPIRPKNVFWEIKKYLRAAPSLALDDN